MYKTNKEINTVFSNVHVYRLMNVLLVSMIVMRMPLVLTWNITSTVLQPRDTCANVCLALLAMELSVKTLMNVKNQFQMPLYYVTARMWTIQNAVI